MSKKTLTRYDINQYARKVGDLKKGVFEKFKDVDMKAHGFYLVVDDATGKVCFRFYAAPNQRRKNGANRTLLRIRRREHQPSAMVALLDSASLYFVSHEKIMNLFGLPNLIGSTVQSAIRLNFGDGENYTEYNRALNDIYEFEFQPY